MLLSNSSFLQIGRSQNTFDLTTLSPSQSRSLDYQALSRIVCPRVCMHKVQNLKVQNYKCSAPSMSNTHTLEPGKEGEIVRHGSCNKW